MSEMPNELRSALVNSESLNTGVVVGPHPLRRAGTSASAERKVSGSLNDSDTIHSSGNSCPHQDQRRPTTVHQRLVFVRPSPSPLTCDRSVLKPLTKTNAMMTTVKNSSTETAEPTPRFTSVTFCR